MRIVLKRCGPSLKFNREEFLVAIQHLDDLNLIQAPDISMKPRMPDVIFVNLNAVLDKVGEIVEKSYVWRNKVPHIDCQLGMRLSSVFFRNNRLPLGIMCKWE